jgi:hypothetical protein
MTEQCDVGLYALIHYEYTSTFFFTKKICVDITHYNGEICIFHFVDGDGTGLQGSYDYQQGY